MTAEIASDANCYELGIRHYNMAHDGQEPAKNYAIARNYLSKIQEGSTYHMDAETVLSAIVDKLHLINQL